MKLINSLVYALLSMTTLAILASCQDEDFGYTTEEVRAGVYDRNFIKHYGEIDPNQSWDFSAFGLIDRIAAAREAAEEAGMTRGTGTFGTWCPEETSVTVEGQTITATKTAPGSFTESHDLIQWVKKRLMEGDYRLNKGDGKTNKEEFSQRFSMIATEKSFQLMPIFQGIDNTIWDLHAVVEWTDDAQNYQKADIVLWRKSEGMNMKGERPNLLGESIQDYVSSLTSGLSTDGFSSVANLSSASSSKVNPNDDVRYETTRLAADIKTQSVTVTGYPTEGRSTINFYLHILQDNDNVNSSMTEDENKNKFWSDGRENENQMSSNIVVLPVQVDIVEYKDYEIVLMGCETALSSKLGGKAYTNPTDGTKHDYGDDDMNDIVFLLIGDKDTHKLPELVNHNEISKRYFFEDLGSVVDWDFNDVVLDMTQEIYVEDNQKKIKQTATLKHRCGTTPFDLYLTDRDGKPTEKLNFDELEANGHIPGVNEGEEMEASQTIVLVNELYQSSNTYKWIPSANNVGIKVYPSSTPYEGKVDEGQYNTDGIWSEYKERNQGSNIPRVFVADRSVWWTAENQNFPNMWARPEEAITTKPAGAVPNDYSNGTIYGIGSDRSFRYPYLEGGEFILWNTPTRFDKWEPLWLSEGFMEGLSKGYNTIHFEFGECTTEFALLYRKDYKEQDEKVPGHDVGNHSNPRNSPFVYTIPDGDTETGGSIQWYLKQMEDGFSPSFGIQDHGVYGDGGHAYTGSDPGGWYITINKVWMDHREPVVDIMDMTWNTVYDFVMATSENWDRYGKMEKDKFENVEVGDEIIVYIKDIQGSKAAYLKEKGGSWPEIGNHNYNYDNGQLSIYVNSDNLSQLQNNGLAIQGYGFTIEQIKLKKVKEINWNETVNFALTDDSYFNYAKMDKNKFNDMQVGDVITVNISNVKSDAQCAFQSNWTNLVDAEDLSGKTSFSLTVTSEILTKLQANGLAIQGMGYTITSVTKTVPTYTLTVNIADGCSSMGTVTPATGTHPRGTSVQVSATPNSGYRFVSWSDGGAQTHNVTVDGNKTVTATFEQIQYYDVTIATGANGSITISGGNISGSQTIASGNSYHNGHVESGTVFHVIASPATGYDFDKWSADNNTNATRDITVNGNVNTTANFKVKTYTLTLEATNGGKYKINGGEPVASYTHTYDYGSTVSVEAIPADVEAYTFNNWSDGEANASRSFTMTENKTVKAKFSAAGAVTILSQSILIGGNNSSHTLTSEQVQAIENAFSDGKKTIVISFSKMSGNTLLSLKTGYYQEVVAFDIKTNDESANIQLTQANIKKIKDENNSIQLVNSGSDITITSISMQ